MPAIGRWHRLADRSPACYLKSGGSEPQPLSAIDPSSDYHRVPSQFPSSPMERLCEALPAADRKPVAFEAWIRVIKRALQNHSYSSAGTSSSPSLTVFSTILTSPFVTNS